MSNEKINLWHYTSLEGLKGILTSQNLWATHYRFLNDYSELIYSKTLLQREVFPRLVLDVAQKYSKNMNFRQDVDRCGGIKGFSRQATELTLDILYEALLNLPLIYPPFVLSFSMPKENEYFIQKNGRLSQWRGYGKDGGYAIILNRERLLEEFKLEQSSYNYGISGGGQVQYNLKKLNPSDQLIQKIEIIKNYAFRVYRYGIHKEQLAGATDSDKNNMKNIYD